MVVTAVQANGGPKYEKTTDPRRMLTHKLLNEAIRTDWGAVKAFLPARVATSMRYDEGAKTAHAWDEGGQETKIDLPLQSGWYVPDGNPFAIPNGKPSNFDDSDALYLCRLQGSSFCGSLARGVLGFGRRVVVAYSIWSIDSGVALIGGREAVAPLKTATGTHLAVGLQLIRNPTELIVRGTPEQLEAAVRMLESLK